MGVDLAEIMRRIDEAGLSIGQVRVLSALNSAGGSACSSEIVGSINRHKAHVSFWMKPLIEKGLVARSEVGADGRRRVFSLTDEGRKLIKALETRHE